MNQSLGKALKLLEILSAQENGLGLSAIARIAQLPKGTTHRLLQSLVEYGYVSQVDDSKYVLGIKVLLLSQNITDTKPIIRFARPVMEELSAATNETINLATLGENCIVYLDEILTTQPVGTISKLGTTAPLHCTALGKAMLAYFPENKVLEMLSNYSFTKYTDHTFITLTSFQKELEVIRKQGYSVDNIEYETEKRCVAAPILDGFNRVIASISISGPFFRVTEEKAHEYGILLRDYSKKVTSMLAFSD